MIKQILSKIYCLLGFHEWDYIEDSSRCNRNCTECDKKQHSMYDMGSGGTYWKDGYYW